MPKIKHLVGIFVAIVAFGAPQQAGAQSQTIITNGPFGIGAKIQCFEIPEENQEASCWVYHEGDQMIQRSLDDGDQPVNPCQFKSGCPELKPIFLPVTAKLVTGDGRWTCGSGGPGDPCAPTPPSGGEDPTPAHGPVVPTRTPQGASTEAPPTVQP